MEFLYTSLGRCPSIHVSEQRNIAKWYSRLMNRIIWSLIRTRMYRNTSENSGKKKLTLLSFTSAVGLGTNHMFFLSLASFVGTA